MQRERREAIRAVFALSELDLVTMPEAPHTSSQNRTKYGAPERYLLPEDSSAIIDETFARDVAEAVAAHREPLNPPEWD